MATDSIWITYAYRDRFAASMLYRELQKAGLNPLIDEDVMRLGQAWSPKLIEGVERSSVLLLLLSPEAAASEGVKNELNAARRSGKIIAPVLLTNDWGLLEQFELREIHTRQLRSPEDLTLIVRDIKELVEPGMARVMRQVVREDFSADFVRMFQRLFDHKDTSKILLHYSGNLTLKEVFEIQEAVNTILRYRLYSLDDNLVPGLIRHEELLSVTAYTHPASTEILLGLAQASLIAVGSSPELQNFLINVFSSAFWDAVKVLASRTRIRLAAAHKSDGQWEELNKDPSGIVLREEGRERIVESAERIIRNEFRIGFSDGMFVIGVQRQELNQNILES